MADIPGIQITDKLVPTDTADTYPTHEDIYGLGGLHVLLPGTTRSGIPTARLKKGMLVRDTDAGLTYRLTTVSPLVWQTMPDEVTLLAATTSASAEAAQATINAASASASAGSAVASASVATSTATTAKLSADAATINANAAIAASASFPVVAFLGTITALNNNPGVATTLAGKWWQIGVSGLLSHANSGGLAVDVGDRLLSNGTSWIRWLLPPFYIPDGSLNRKKVELSAQRQWGMEGYVLGYAWAVMDSERRLGIGLRDDGVIVGKLGVNLGIANGLGMSFANGITTINLGSVDGKLPVGDGSIDSSIGRDDVAFSIVDSSGRQAFRIDVDGTTTIQKGGSLEMIAARGSRSTLTERLDSGFNSHGLPKNGRWGTEFLRETKQRLRKLSMLESSSFCVLMIGDSWTHMQVRYSGSVASILKTTYGDAGLGWVGFSWPTGIPSLINGSVDPVACTLVVTGSWSPAYWSSTSPDIGQIESSTVGDGVTVTGPDSCSAVVLFHRGNGAVRYRWNSGAWTNVTLSGTTLQTVSLDSVPAGAWTLNIEVVSGTPVLCGCDIQKTTSGVRVHRLGSTGSRTSQWAAVNASEWQSGITALAPNLVMVMHGTNEQSSYAPTTFRTHLNTILTRVRLAAPTADILLIAPCENNRVGNAWPMTDYATQTFQAAEAFSAAFVNLQPLFGLTQSDYSSVSARPWFHADLVHPAPTTGGRAIVDAVLRTITLS